MKLTKSKFEQIIREEVVAALLESEYDAVSQDPNTRKWWIYDEEGYKSGGPYNSENAANRALGAQTPSRHSTRSPRRFGRRIPRREGIDSAAIAIAKLKENTEIELATLIEKVIVEVGGMRGLRKKTKTGAIAKAREAAEAAKKAEEPSQSPEEKEKAEQERLARLAKFGHLYINIGERDDNDVEESQDE